MPGAGGGGVGELLFNGGGVSVLQDENVLETDGAQHKLKATERHT